MIFGSVENEIWTGELIENPSSYRGHTFGLTPTLDAYQAAGLWPLIDDRPEQDPATHTLEPGPIEADAPTRTLRRVWTAQPISLVQLRAAKQAELQESARAAILAGVTSDALGALHTYPTSETDQLNMAGLAIKAENAERTGDLAWRCKFWCADEAGQWARREHTAAQIIQIGESVIAHVQAAQDRYEQLLTAVASADSAAGVAAVSWS